MVKYTNPLNRPPTTAQLQQINAYKRGKAAAFGGDYQAYLESRRPPLSPTEHALRALKTSSVGDKGYEEELILNDRHLKEADRKFWLENDKWFNPDGSRRYSDPADQAAYDAYMGRKTVSRPVQGTATSILKSAAAPAIAAAAKQYLPALTAPPPGQRHMLFTGKNIPTLRDRYMASAFSQAGGMPPVQTQTGGVPADGMMMPSNLNRFYQLQNGAQQTPYAHLVDQHAANINGQQKNPAGFNAGVAPYSYQSGPYQPGGYGSYPQYSYASAFNPSVIGAAFGKAGYRLL